MTSIQGTLFCFVTLRRALCTTCNTHYIKKCSALICEKKNGLWVFIEDVVIPPPIGIFLSPVNTSAKLILLADRQ